ncbi:MAG: SUMF1/EgtB/PvdO family nonheme iron enzyme, partial [Myxococcota bacterium]
AVAGVALGVPPTAGISWYQARAACENAGKRLCTLAEWERACRGMQSLIYPYGDTIDQAACNGFFAYTESYEMGEPESTGSFDTCGSPWGAYDMSGNLEEWTLDAWPRLPGTTPLNDRAVRGGSFKSNSRALACIGQEFHEPPGSVDIDRGFRCCSDGPVN